MLDLLLAVVGPAPQHVAQMVEPFAQTFGEPHHLGDAALDQHVAIRRKSTCPARSEATRLHQQFRIDRARFRLDDQADVLGEFVADVANQRQLLVVEQFGDLLDQP